MNAKEHVINKHVINIGLFCLLVLRFNVPVNNFSVISGQSNRFLGTISTFGECLAQGHNTAEVGFEPPLPLNPESVALPLSHHTPQYT